MDDVKKNVAPEITEEQSANAQAINAIEHISSDVILRNLAFWLDVAIAKGRFIDMKEQNGMSTPDKDKE